MKTQIAPESEEIKKFVACQSTFATFSQQVLPAQVLNPVLAFSDIAEAKAKVGAIADAIVAGDPATIKIDDLRLESAALEAREPTGLGLLPAGQLGVLLPLFHAAAFGLFNTSLVPSANASGR